NGFAYYIGTFPSKEFLKEFIKYISQTYKIEPLFKDVPYGIEITQRVKDGKVFTFLLNHSEEIKTINIGGKKKDLLTGREYEGLIDIYPREVLILED
ncbi:MAG: Beta-galactosidase C-terminal domain, partial [Dictyoglomus sp.]